MRLWFNNKEAIIKKIITPLKLDNPGFNGSVDPCCIHLGVGCPLGSTLYLQLFDFGFLTQKYEIFCPPKDLQIFQYEEHQCWHMEAILMILQHMALLMT